MIREFFVACFSPSLLIPRSIIQHTAHKTDFLLLAPSGGRIAFFYKPPLSPLSPAQLFDFPELKVSLLLHLRLFSLLLLTSLLYSSTASQTIYLRGWGYFDTSLLYPILPTSLPPNSKPVERVSLVSFKYDVEVFAKEDSYEQREGVYKEVSERSSPPLSFVLVYLVEKVENSPADPSALFSICHRCVRSSWGRRSWERSSRTRESREVEVVLFGDAFERREQLRLELIALGQL